MSAPVIWVFIPGILAILLFLTNRWYRVNSIIAFFAAFLLALLAILLPIGKEASFGPFSYQIRESLIILGRQIIITSSDIPTLVILFLGMAVWIAGGYFVNVPRLFPSVAMGISALLVSALSVQPFLYAAVLIELAALTSVPLLTSPGEKVGSGILRMLTSYTIGMPAILFVGWMLTASIGNVAVSDFQTQAALFLAIGFMFLLAIFPLHSWVPMLIEQSHPFTAAFAIFWLTQASLLFGYGLLRRYELAPDPQIITDMLRIIGLFIVVINSVFLLFQKDMGRMLGFFILSEVGFAILAMSLQSPLNDTLFYSLSFLKILPIVLYAFCLALVQFKYHSLNFRNLTGLIQRNQWIATGIIVSIFCLLGMPLLPIFPVKYQIIAELWYISPVFYIGLLVAFVASIISIVRVTYVFFMNREGEGIFESEKRSIKISIWAGILLLVIGGVTSGFFIKALLGLSN